MADRWSQRSDGSIAAAVYDRLRQLTGMPHVIAATLLLLVAGTAGRYGWMGDELYYLACSKHLAFGYVDHPPLVAFVAFLVRSVAGESLVAFRFVSGLSGAITVLLTASIARHLGGGRSAQAFAALLICSAATFPALSGFYSMNAFDLALVAAFILVTIRTVNEPSLRHWATLGIISGVGLLNKYTFLVLGFSCLAGLLLTRRRGLLASPYPYVCGGIALLLFAPHVIWQVANDVPTREFIQNATSLKNISLSPVEFFTQLTITLNPLTAPVWVTGFFFLFRRGEQGDFRYLGVLAAVFCGVYLLQSSKFYYVAPVFPLLFAMGAVTFERWWSLAGKGWIRYTAVTSVLVSGILLLPLSVPILGVQNYVTYAKALGLWNAVRMENWEGDAMPIHYVHRLGWPELVDSVSAAYAALPEHEQKVCGIIGGWYGPAAAVDHFGAGRGLPPALSGHNSYWTWGSRGYTGEVMIAVNFPEEDLRRLFDDVTPAGTVFPAYGVRHTVHVCRMPKMPLAEMWPHLRQFI